MLTKVRTALPIPKHCDCCCSVNIEFTTNEKIYATISGDWPYIYYCNDCRAAVGCHAGTNIPLGRMADRATRRLRKKAHEEFDKLWRGGYMTRDRAYNWLASELLIENEQCHIAWLTKDQLEKAAQVSKEYLACNTKALIRRRKKQDARESKRTEREFKRTKKYRENR